MPRPAIIRSSNDTALDALGVTGTGALTPSGLASSSSRDWTKPLMSFMSTIMLFISFIISEALAVAAFTLANCSATSARCASGRLALPNFLAMSIFILTRSSLLAEHLLHPAHSLGVSRPHLVQIFSSRQKSWTSLMMLSACHHSLSLLDSRGLLDSLARSALAFGFFFFFWFVDPDFDLCVPLPLSSLKPAASLRCSSLSISADVTGSPSRSLSAISLRIMPTHSSVVWVQTPCILHCLSRGRRARFSWASAADAAPLLCPVLLSAGPVTSLCVKVKSGMDPSPIALTMSWNSVVHCPSGPELTASWAYRATPPCVAVTTRVIPLLGLTNFALPCTCS